MHFNFLQHRCLTFYMILKVLNIENVLCEKNIRFEDENDDIRLPLRLVAMPTRFGRIFPPDKHDSHQLLAVLSRK